MKSLWCLPRSTGRPAMLWLALAALGGGLMIAGCAVRTTTVSDCLPGGDVVAGQTAFGELMCYTCHRVAGAAETFPLPTANPPVPVELGAEAVPPTRGALVTSIIDPSHEIAPGYREELVADGQLSRMGDYSHLLTVRQLADLVAYLQSLHEPTQALD